jgi:hypothetical protein
VPEQKLLGATERRMSPEDHGLETVPELCGDLVRFVAPQGGAQYLRGNDRPCQTLPGPAQAVKFGIGPGSGNRMSGEAEQHVKTRQPDLAQFLTSASGDTRPVHQERRHVAAQRRADEAQPARAQWCAK